jgi:hypothetical protein
LALAGANALVAPGGVTRGRLPAPALLLPAPAPGVLPTLRWGARATRAPAGDGCEWGTTVVGAWIDVARKRGSSRASEVE